MLHDLFSDLPTDQQTAEQAYRAYWAVATSEVNELASGTGPVYRFARENMIRAIMRDFGLTIAEVAWLYDQVLPEGPGWGSLTSMVNYGKAERFGLNAIASAVSGCMGNHDDVTTPDDGYLHAIDCPFRK